MLSYRHAFHAGNFADVHKHVALVCLLRLLQRKERGYCYVDTHAGAGTYALTPGADVSAGRRGRAPGGERGDRHGHAAAGAPPGGHRGEWRDGIARVQTVLGQAARGVAAEETAAGCAAGGVGSGADEEVPDDVRHYAEAVAAAGAGTYPGSPVLARRLARAQDRALLFELHPRDGAALKAHFCGDRRVAVHAPRDAREGAPALLPPRATPRGLALVDPGYERQAEYTEAADLVAALRAHWPTATVMVWYPLLGGPRRGRHTTLLERLRDRPCGAIWRSEIRCRDEALPGLVGSGLLVAQPVWPFHERWPAVAAWLQGVLAADVADGPAAREEWFQEESPARRGAAD